MLGLVQSSAISPKMVLPPDSPLAPGPREPPSEPSCPDCTGGFTHPPLGQSQGWGNGSSQSEPTQGPEGGVTFLLGI